MHLDCEPLAASVRGAGLPTRVAHLVADGQPGGGTTMVLGLIDDLLSQDRFEMTVISQPGSYLQAEVELRGLPFIGLDFFTSIFDLSLPWRLARKLGGQCFNISHLHGLRAAHHSVRWPVRSQLGRLVYTVHGLHQLHQPSWMRVLANFADRQVMRRADDVVFVSEADFALAKKWRLMEDAVQGRVIYNGIEICDQPAPTPVGAVADVAFIGRLVEQKDPEAATRALAALASQGYRCVMAGDGPLRDKCQKLLSSLPGGARVNYLGGLSHSQALALLATVRVLLVTSRWEGLPILPIEAAALGVPVVGRRIAGLDEVIDDGVTGILTGSKLPQALVDAVTELLNDATRMQCFGAAAKQRVKSMFDRSRCSDDYLTLYQRFIKEPKA